MRRLVVVGGGLLAMLAGGCTTYAPLPLAADPPTLAPPIAAVLEQQAAATGRPYLALAAIDLAQPLDGNAVATLAVVNNPDLKAQRSRAGISDAQAFAARLLPDPTFSIGASRVLTGPDPFVDLTSALGFDLAMLRSRGIRLAQARAAAQQVRLDLAWAEWQVAGQARIQAVRVVALDRVLALATLSQAATRSLLERTLRAAGRGDLAPDQLQAARIGAYDAQERVRVAARDLAAARFELVRLLGLPPGYAVRLAPLPPVPRLPATAALFALARARADLRALEAGYAAQEAVVRKAILDQFPTFGIAINGARDSAGNALVGPVVDLTLPLWNRNRGGIAIERATRAALKADYDARLFQTRAEIAAAVSGIAVADAQRAAIARDLPALRTFAAASRRAAARGDLAPATAETAEQAVRDKESLATEIDQDIAERMIALELLTGTPEKDWPR